MFNLGILENEQGDPGQAATGTSRPSAPATPTRHPKAMFNLGVLEDEQGNPGQARHWYQQAIATGHPDAAPGAMVNLGVLEYEQGDLGQARHWYQQAIATGHPDQAPRAMVNLGVLERHRGTLAGPATGSGRPSPPATPPGAEGRGGNCGTLTGGRRNAAAVPTISAVTAGRPTPTRS